MLIAGCLCLLVGVLIGGYWGSSGTYAPDDASVMPFQRKRLLIVMQFALFQFELVRENVDSWEDSRLFPCDNHGSQSYVDIVFYVSVDPGWVEARALSLLEKSKARGCFRNVLFKNCNLQPHEDVYGVGTVTMFYRTFNSDLVPGYEEYHYMLLMEPDLRPVRAGWMHQLERAIAPDDFWSKGSVPRYPTNKDDLHINGNALYRLNDAEFKQHVLDSQGAFPDSFDQSLYVHRVRDWPMHQRVAHKFIASELIINNLYGFTYWTLEDALKTFPDTYLIHGRHAVKAVCSYIQCKNSTYGGMSLVGG